MTLNETFTSIEQKFNIAGGIPFVAVFSSSVRTVAGQIQAIAGIVMAVFSLIAQLVDRANGDQWESKGLIGVEHIVHGSLNIFRGIGESIMAILLVGSLILLGAQAVSKNGFNPIFKYGQRFSAPIPQPGGK